MNKGYLFIANSTKPTPEKANSMQPYTIGTFGYAPVKAANEMGYKLFFGLNRDTAEQVKCTNFDIQFYNAHIYRDVFAFKDNWIAYKNLVKLLKEHPEIEVIHCNTPIGGIVGRYAAKKCGVKKVIYQAHGFHFYKGAPFVNRTLFYNIEKHLAKYTDVLVTINNEDLEAAKAFKLKKGGKLCYVHGVGIDLSVYDNVSENREKKRAELGLDNDDIAVISVGELNKNKNNIVIAQAMSKIKNKHLHYYLCGVGQEKENIKSFASEHGINENIHFITTIVRSEFHQVIPCVIAVFTHTFKKQALLVLIDFIKGAL